MKPDLIKVNISDETLGWLRAVLGAEAPDGWWQLVALLLGSTLLHPGRKKMQKLGRGTVLKQLLLVIPGILSKHLLPSLATGFNLSTRKSWRHTLIQRPGTNTIPPSLLRRSRSPGHFKVSKKDNIEQIDITQVTADACGIAICTLAVPKPYLGQAVRSPLMPLLLDFGRNSSWGPRSCWYVTTTRFPVIFWTSKGSIAHPGLHDSFRWHDGQSHCQDPVSSVVPLLRLCSTSFLVIISVVLVMLQLKAHLIKLFMKHGPWHSGVSIIFFWSSQLRWRLFCLSDSDFPFPVSRVGSMDTLALLDTPMY